MSLGENESELPSLDFVLNADIRTADWQLCRDQTRSNKARQCFTCWLVLFCPVSTPSPHVHASPLCVTGSSASKIRQNCHPAAAEVGELGVDADEKD